MPVTKQDDYAITSISIVPNAKRTFQKIVDFRDRDKHDLPPAAAAALDEFVTQPNKTFETTQTGLAAALGLPALLASFRAEFESLIADSEALSRSRVDRAFLHLDRLLIANESVAAE